MSDEALTHSDDYKVVATSQSDGGQFHYHPMRVAGSGYEVATVPPHVDIELTNICDLACEFCETLVMKRNKGLMTFKTFKKVVDQCHAIGVRSVKLNLWGESVLNKKLCEMVEYAKQNTNLILQFNTNANRLAPEISRRLVAAGLDRLTVSVDGITKETYEKLRVRGKYERVFDNIHRLFELKKSLGANKPHVTLQIIRTTENHHEIAPFVEYWGKYADQVSVTNISITATESVLRFSLREKKGRGKKPCEQPWQRISVLWDGTVTVCCFDFEGLLAIGHIDRNSLLELWRGEKMAELRKRHASLDFQGLICNTCTETKDFAEL